MTTRIRTYYKCSNGHHGEKCFSENDQPYSAMWEMTELENMGETDDGYVCNQCGEPMKEVTK